MIQLTNIDNVEAAMQDKEVISQPFPHARVRRALWCGLLLLTPAIVVLTLLLGDLLLIRYTPCVDDLLPNLVKLNHYGKRSFEEYVGRRKIPYDEGWATWSRDAKAASCVDQTIQRFVPSLQMLRNMTWVDRQSKYHQGPFCVNRAVHAGDQGNVAEASTESVVSDCRAHFLVAATTINDEDAYLKEWLDYHSVIGIDHFLLYDVANSSKTRQILEPYIEHGAVEYFDHSFGSFDHRVPGVEEIHCHRCHSYAFLKKKTFWVMNFELDEFFYPTYGNSLREVFTPLTELNGPEVALAVGYHQMSGAPFLHPPKVGGQIENYVKTHRKGATPYANGKAFALVDFIREDLFQPEGGQPDCCFPHRIPIKQGYRYVSSDAGRFSGTLRPATLQTSGMAYFLEAPVWGTIWHGWWGEADGPAVLRIWVPLYLLTCSVACSLYGGLRCLGESHDAIQSQVAKFLGAKLVACRCQRTAIGFVILVLLTSLSALFQYYQTSSVFASASVKRVHLNR